MLVEVKFYLMYIREALQDVEDILKNYHRTHDFVEEVMEKYRELFRGRKFLEISHSYQKTIIFGDIHGDLDSLVWFLEKAREKGFPEDARLLFLGDYIDRGPKQLESIMLIFFLFMFNPDSIITLRGNHEPPEHLVPYPHDFPYVLEEKFGKTKGSILYIKFFDIFQLMPLGIIGEGGKTLFLHGGLPTVNYGVTSSSLLDYLGGEGMDWKDEYTEILWNDPIETDIASEPSYRGVGFLWGNKVTRWVKHNFGLNLLVRGHEPVDKGYKLNHDNVVLTLFSRTGPPYFNTSACIYMIEKRPKNYIFKSSNLICRNTM